MLALSIRQPWAHAIFHLGKDVENRSWKTKYRGPFLIHAGKMLDTSFYYHIGGLFPRDMDTDGMEFGAILGMAHIDDVVEQSDSKWFFGKYGYKLSHIERFERPVKCKGKQGFFKLNEEVAAAVDFQIEQIVRKMDL